MSDFVGAKAAFFCGGAVLTYLRDDKPDLPWPALWDLPGGGREGGESPETCLLRELQEEFGLLLPPDRLLWRSEFPAMIDPRRSAFFFAGRISAAEITAIRFGEEGQFWQMMDMAEFCSHPKGIPSLQERAAAAWAALA
jgi:8-oxo-dGTP diphosphatase